VCGRADPSFAKVYLAFFEIPSASIKSIQDHAQRVGVDGDAQRLPARVDAFLEIFDARKPSLK